jgi:hypothetical protein
MLHIGTKYDAMFIQYFSLMGLYRFHSNHWIENFGKWTISHRLSSQCFGILHINGFITIT